MPLLSICNSCIIQIFGSEIHIYIKKYHWIKFQSHVLCTPYSWPQKISNKRHLWTFPTILHSLYFCLKIKFFPNIVVDHVEGYEMIIIYHISDTSHP